MPSSADPPPTRFYHDYVDPASYLVDRSLRSLGVEARRSPFEIRRPPASMIDDADPRWMAYLSEMEARAEAADAPFRPPSLVPWTRKAHELAWHAVEAGCFAEVDERLYDAYFGQGLDIGRVDVLVEIAVASGLDGTETKAALDVDRHSARIEEERTGAVADGIRGVPTLVAGGGKLEGFHPEEEIRTFLQRAVDAS